MSVTKNGRARVGLVGCGIIAKAYTEGAVAFDSFSVEACADSDAERAEAMAAGHGLEVMTVEELISSPEIDVILNLTPVPRPGYRIGLPRGGKWKEALNSDAQIYGGSNQGNFGGVTAHDHACHGQPHSAEFNLPPLSVVVFQAE